MRRPVPIAELQRSGVRLQTAEALAVVRQLIRNIGNDSKGPRSVVGPPTIENVFIELDGRVSCSACETTPAVSEIAILLQQLLADAAGVPGSLRYTIARALLEVDAPPFDSIDQFSAALARHERGDAQSVVRALIDRVARTESAPSSIVERRRAAPSVAELRRQLREADLRVYDQQLALDAMVAMTGKWRPRVVSRAAIVMSAALVLALMGAGDRWRGLRSDTQAATPTPDIRSTPAPDATPAHAPRSGELRAIAAAGPPNAPERIAPTESAQKRTTHRGDKPARTGAVRSRRAPANGLLHRLHLGWLRGKVAVRNDAP